MAYISPSDAITLLDDQMEISMTDKKPAIERDVPRELAQIQRERGYALTKAEFKSLGYTEDQLADDQIERAAEIYATEIERRAA